jgi:hypothetical protein
MFAGDDHHAVRSLAALLDLLRKWGRLNLTGAHINAVDLDARERAIGLRCGRSHRGIELLTGIAGLTRL